MTRERRCLYTDRYWKKWKLIKPHQFAVYSVTLSWLMAIGLSISFYTLYGHTYCLIPWMDAPSLRLLLYYYYYFRIVVTSVTHNFIEKKKKTFKRYNNNVNSSGNKTCRVFNLLINHWLHILCYIRRNDIVYLFNE